jgi:hypothetical protein
MKYIVTEEQYKLISEIRVQEGTWDITDSYVDIFNIVKERVNEKNIKNAVKDYIKNELGYSLTKFKGSDAKKYTKLFPDNIEGDYNDIPSELKTKDVLSNLAYYLAKKFLRIKRLRGLDCFIEQPRWGGKQYFFFDPELEQSIGSIAIKEISDFFGDVKFPKNSWAVSTSGLDKEAKGTGLGKQMYLAVIDDVDVLFSDNFLYLESLNIWVNVLPNYVYVGAVFNNVHKKPRRLSPKTKILDHEEVKRYFATKSPELIKIKTSK